MDILCILKTTPDCPFTADQIETLNARFKAGFEAYAAVRVEQEANYQALLAQGLLKDLPHKAAIVQVSSSTSLGQRWYTLNREVLMAETETTQVTPAVLPEALEDEISYQRTLMSVKENDASGVSVKVIAYFREIGGYDSVEKLAWMLKYCPAGYFSYTMRRALMAHQKLLQEVQ